MTRTTYRGLVALAALAVVTALPGTAGVAAAGEVPAYRTADGATATTGTPSAADAPRLTPGMHTDSIGRGERKYYAVTLDDRTSAYFSAVAAPRPGTKVQDYGDQLAISVQDSGGGTCGPVAHPSFHSGGAAYPIADYAVRRIGADRTDCQKAGPYYLVISRKGTGASGPGSWPVEIGYLTEPALKGGTPDRPGDGTWSSAAPAPPTDTDKRDARGGTGFNDAGSVAKGVWQDRIRPGEARFYRVPVDWGQQLNISAELPNSTLADSTAGAATTGVTKYVPNALGLSLFNPARGAVRDNNFVSYSGRPAAAREFTAPVAYGNRLHPTGAVSAMRFAGWYYLEVTLNPGMAQYFPEGADLTLRVDVLGTAQAGPGYSRPTGDFSVTPTDRDMADKGQPAQGAAKSGTLMAVAYAGIGTGVTLLMGLVVWRVVARRKWAQGARGAGVASAGSVAPVVPGVVLPGPVVSGAVPRNLVAPEAGSIPPAGWSEPYGESGRSMQSVPGQSNQSGQSGLPNELGQPEWAGRPGRPPEVERSSATRPSQPSQAPQLSGSSNSSHVAEASQPSQTSQASASASASASVSPSSRTSQEAQAAQQGREAEQFGPSQGW
ncbi:hypothetical protein [Streptomyces celluloflavus]|uniref:hypothetical protein n=1 Tax=Streptomyces celluloflavus TaxID=58344 RepID=UPI003669AFD4